MKALVVVIGGGQAGLATGYHLKRAGLPFRILDAHGKIGDSWRNRYRSLTLFTPRAFSALPGLALQGEAEGYPSRDEFASYLEAHASAHELPVTTGALVTRLAQPDEAGFELTLAKGETISASHVVIATGGFQTPLVPRISESLHPDVLQLTAGSYREPGQIPPSPVLVVGDGATGRDIAVELARSHAVMLATGKPRKLFPEKLLGKSIWWWMRTLGLMKVSGNSPFGRAMRRADPFPDRDRNLESLRRRHVQIFPRLAGALGRTASFSDGTSAEVGTVIWAVGYRDDFSWIDIPAAIAPDRRLIHTEGVSPVRGLYSVGRPWQRNRASALVMGADHDAAKIVAAIKAGIGAA